MKKKPPAYMKTRRVVQSVILARGNHHVSIINGYLSIHYSAIGSGSMAYVYMRVPVTRILRAYNWESTSLVGDRQCYYQLCCFR